VKLQNNVQIDTGWEIFEDSYVPEQQVTTGSNYMIGNGYLGYRGTFADDEAVDYVACVVSDTYDNADGTWKELVTAPNGLYTAIEVDGKPIRMKDAPWTSYRRELNYRYGEWSVTAESDAISIQEHRFASAADVHLIASTTTITAHRTVEIGLVTGIDGAVWSINGDHFVERDDQGAAADLEVTAVTGEHGYDVVVRERGTVTDGSGAPLTPTEEAATPRSGEGVARRYSANLELGETLTVTKFVSIYTTNDLRSEANPHTVVAVPDEPAPVGTIDPATSAAAARRAQRGIDDPNRPSRESVRSAAAASLDKAQSAGWDALRNAHRAVWDERWDSSDVEIAGDEVAQSVLRYNLYHNFIATPTHTDHLPIGARGLSCQAYQGAAFWDQEIFNLPMFVYTAPEIARNILVYRYRTLDGARRKAKDLGYRGAFYAWISGDSGEEICPAYFFRDLVSGRRIRNHFNDWQIHVSPDIAYTVRRYVTATGDFDFLKRYGAEIVFEVARFLVSRVHYRPDRRRYEIIRVLGPDEYHENVDNNFFTNFQTRFALEYAMEVYRWLEENAREEFARVTAQIGLEVEETELWNDVAERLYVPEPDRSTGLIEQFSGFFQHEDTTPGAIKERLIEGGEYWGWPNGIAFETQVSKQADVTQLFALHPTAYDAETMRANWEYYEPRTQHGSSLSPAVYAIVAAWVGHTDEAKRYFMKSCTVDLYNDNKAVSGGTFIGGIHTAACGISWQIVVLGFAGMYLTEDGFGFKPRLPEGWERLRFRLQRWGEEVELTVTARRSGGTTASAASVRATGSSSNTKPVGITVGGEHRSVGPGETVELEV
jgi:trehalose/maltose hydrolase-like predicted phosphorylase